MANFESEQELAHPYHPATGPQLWLQWGKYVYDDGKEEYGYRFIWTRSDGSIQSRGPARIPSLRDVELLIAAARQQGWGDNQVGD
jgi:hypothetical protein